MAAQQKAAAVPAMPGNGIGAAAAANRADKSTAAVEAPTTSNGAPPASPMSSSSGDYFSQDSSSSGGMSDASSDSDLTSSSREAAAAAAESLPVSSSSISAAAAAAAAADSASDTSEATLAAAATATAAAAAPRGPPAPPAVSMQSGASMLPHPEKAHRGGEDAFFISEPPLAVGVADGVGGWAEIGVDAGAYARLLMLHAKEEAEALLGGGGGDAGAPLSPQTVLERAYYRTNVQGSSTVCILALNGSTLCASNLGDSGFVIVRDGSPAFQSPQQQHNFNFPYQLGSADGGASDHPQSAMRFELTVRAGDIVITGSDGLWDNVFAEEASTIVSRCRAQGDGPEAAAHTLCRYARMRATDPKYHSPFSYSAIQAGYVFLGGKLDDITVLVSYVSDAKEATAAAEEEEQQKA